jgi:hypothetical protein
MRYGLEGANVHGGIISSAFAFQHLILVVEREGRRTQRMATLCAENEGTSTSYLLRHIAG